MLIINITSNMKLMLPGVIVIPVLELPADKLVLKGKFRILSNSQQTVRKMLPSLRLIGLFSNNIEFFYKKYT